MTFPTFFIVRGFRASRYGTRYEFQDHNLVKVVFDQIGREFWKLKPLPVAQAVLTLLAALLSELMANATLCNLLLPIVVNLVRHTFSFFSAVFMNRTGEG